MRAQHYAAFESAVKAAVPALAALTFDGEAPLVNGAVRRGTYLILHDMGFDGQDDDRLASSPVMVSDGTYRLVARVVADTRAAIRSVTGNVKSLAGAILAVPGRTCGPMVSEDNPINRDDSVSPPLFWTDIDFTFRSTRT